MQQCQSQGIVAIQHTILVVPARHFGGP